MSRDILHLISSAFFFHKQQNTQQLQLQQSSIMHPAYYSETQDTCEMVYGEDSQDPSLIQRRYEELNRESEDEIIQTPRIIQAPVLMDRQERRIARVRRIAQENLASFGASNVPTQVTTTGAFDDLSSLVLQTQADGSTQNETQEVPTQVGTPHFLTVHDNLDDDDNRSKDA